MEPSAIPGDILKLAELPKKQLTNQEVRVRTCIRNAVYGDRGLQDRDDTSNREQRIRSGKASVRVAIQALQSKGLRGIMDDG